tara:strand:+ start:193 stop:462 length:270 start_codon:yes stop_codon:yes gene_type:complete
MENILIFSFVVCFFFLIFKFFEMKYIDQEYKPAKLIVRDVIMVFIASFLGITLYNKGGNSVGKLFDVITDKKTIPIGSNINVFTDNPNF